MAKIEEDIEEKKVSGQLIETLANIQRSSWGIWLTATLSNNK